MPHRALRRKAFARRVGGFVTRAGLPGQRGQVTAFMTSAHTQLARYHEQGFVILRNVLSASEIEATRAALQPYLDLGMKGRNNFEGEKTHRVYSLVGRGAVFEQSAEHPAVRELLDALLQPGYLLIARQAICR